MRLVMDTTGPTPASIALAKAVMLSERKQIEEQTGVVITLDGRIILPNPERDELARRVDEGGVPN